MHNLAVTSTPFIGRSQELDEIGALLDDPACRLLTLVGPGGIGKTRLATETAARRHESFPDGVYIVSLAPLSRSEDMLTAIAEATPFRFQQDGRVPREQFLDYLREKGAKRLLLVIDNLEHLLDGVDIISEILDATTHVKILATSREALNLQEEWVRQIAGLAYPDHIIGNALENYGAVQLFADRARRIRGDFDLNADRHSVLEICQLVEGMPLAIELAASWLKTLQPADIAHEIRLNMDILATRSRNLPERHRNIRSVFDHSWRLLSQAERDVFPKLSGFRGGFTREAAEVVAGASLHTLAALVDKSLVRLNAAGRYDVHELLRQYGGEQLSAALQAEAMGRAYVDYYLHMLVRLEGDIKSSRQIAALDMIEADFENVRNVWQGAVDSRNFSLLGEAVESLHFYADMRGQYHEVVRMLRETLDSFPQVRNEADERAFYRLRARLIRLILLGNMRIESDVRREIEVCLERARARQDEAEIAFCLLVSGIVSFWKSGEATQPYYDAAALFHESYTIYTTLGDSFYAADALAWIPSCGVEAGEYEPTITIFRRSLDLRTEIGDRNGIAWVMLNLAHVMHTELDYAGCERYARQALALMREIRSLKGLLHAMFKLSEMLFLKGDLEEARGFIEEARVLADDSNNLDGRMISAGMMSLLASVMNEDYAEGMALAAEVHALSQEPFFGGHSDLTANLGHPIAACGLGDYEAALCHLTTLGWKHYRDPAMATLCLSVKAAELWDEGAAQEAAERLSLAFSQPAAVNGWLRRWPLLTRLRADLSEQLGEPAFQAAWERGCGHDLETTVRSIMEALEEPSRPTANQSLIEPLSERELEVLRLIAGGLSNRDIAERLVLSVGTVKVHTRNIYGKLNVGSRTQALAQAAEYHLL
jgi:predicted ATPase/DNA-binding CsgD family transcriptional regulator